MDEFSKPAVVHVETYRALEMEDLNSSVQLKGTGARKTWLASFVKEHLPENRLQSKDDDLGSKFESVDYSRRRKKKQSKSRVSVVDTWSRSQRYNQRHFKLPLDVRYETYLPLMAMWTKYMEELLNFPSLTDASLANAAQKLVKADLHGSFLTVKQSKCSSLIGVQGIVLQETRNMFVLVTPDNTVKRIPKGNSIFCVVLNKHVFTIYGNQFTVKPGERAAKKFKSKPSIDL